MNIEFLFGLLYGLLLWKQADLFVYVKQMSDNVSLNLAVVCKKTVKRSCCYFVIRNSVTVSINGHKTTRTV